MDNYKNQSLNFGPWVGTLGREVLGSVVIEDKTLLNHETKVVVVIPTAAITMAMQN